MVLTPAIRGLIGFNPSSGTARLLAAYGSNIVNLATNTGYAVITDNANDVEFEKFLDRVFFQNYSDRPLTYNTATNLWTNQHLSRAPLSKYIKKYKSRLYLGYCKFPGPESLRPIAPNDDEISFPSRVFYSDLSQASQTYSGLTWGFEWGTNSQVFGNSNIFQIGDPSLTGLPIQQDFKAANIKIGDPLFITSAIPGTLNNPNPKGFYLVTKIDSSLRLSLDYTFPVANDIMKFYVGSNWFDVSPDDGDVITGFGENADNLLVFKLMSLWAYTGSQLKQIPGALGTSYNRSIINDRYGNTYYFHGSEPKLSGIYKYARGSSIKISKAIDPWILAISTDNYTTVVAWAEGNELRWFIGNLSATNYLPLALNNVIATYNVDTEAWSIDPCQDTITARTTWRTGNEEDTYLGTADNEVLQADDGNSYNTVAITSLLETKVYYPSGSEIINDFPYIQIVSRNAKGMRVKYKLWGNPIGGQKYSSFDKEWWGLGNIEDDLTEFPLNNQHNQAAGIQFQFDEMTTLEKDAYVEKISIFYRPNRTKLL